MATQRLDPAQEFAERLMDIVFYAEERSFKEHLANIIANELRAEGWQKVEASEENTEEPLPQYLTRS